MENRKADLGLWRLRWDVKPSDYKNIIKERKKLWCLDALPPYGSGDGRIRQHNFLFERLKTESQFELVRVTRLYRGHKTVFEYAVTEQAFYERGTRGYAAETRKELVNFAFTDMTESLLRLKVATTNLEKVCRRLKAESNRSK